MVCLPAWMFWELWPGSTDHFFTAPRLPVAAPESWLSVYLLSSFFSWIHECRLTYLDLSKNSYQGQSIPQAFSRLTLLARLSMSSSRINGAIDVIAPCTRLQNLDLTFNMLSGKCMLYFFWIIVIAFHSKSVFTAGIFRFHQAAFGLCKTWPVWKAHCFTSTVFQVGTGI